MREQSIGVDTAGGYVVPSSLAATVYDKARARSVAFQAGAMTYPMPTGEVKLAVLTQDFTPVWHQENVEESASSVAFEQRILRAKTIFAMGTASKELMQDSSVARGTFENSLSQSIAVEWDRAILRGSGSGGEILGIRHWDDAGNSITYTALGSGTGAPLDGFDNFLDAMQVVEEANGPGPEGQSIIFSPRTKYDLGRKRDGQGLPLRAPEEYMTARKLSTTAVPKNLTANVAGTQTYTDASEIYVGDFSQVIVGVRAELTIDITDQAGTAFTKYQTWIRAAMRTDMVLVNPEMLVLIEGVLAG
jgi:HK97 family phage major capsid protein